MRLLAFDQSSRITGYALFEDGELINYSKFVCTHTDVGERLVAIRKMLIGLIDIYQPDEVAFEDIQFQSYKENNVKTFNNIKTFKVLAEVFGIFHETLTELGIDFDIVPSVTWKSNLSIKGSNSDEQKRNAALYVLNTYGIKPTQDECDAICIGSYLINKGKDFNWSD